MPHLAPFAWLAVLLVTQATATDEPRVLDPALHHLGDSRVSWPNVPAEPEGPGYELTFESEAIEGEAVLFLRHRDVDDPWHVELNGARVASLRVTKVDGTWAYVLPPGSVIAGVNRLAVTCETTTDDVLLGDVRLDPRPLEVALALGDVEIDVVDADGRGLPARVTLRREDGAAAELYGYAPADTAVRTGLAYPREGRLRARLSSGGYTVWACRGMEWSLAKGRLAVRRGGVARLRLELAREVDTTGWIAADTHVHTVTFSGHGDASIEERTLTLAGEGVELAIATDHNHQTDAARWQRDTGTTGWYTPVTGNEVTTDVGHFNSFPLPPGGPLPDHRLATWSGLVAEMKGKGAKVVVLNHPRWPAGADAPFVRFGFDPGTGAFADARALPVDGIELLNSTWLLDDVMEKFRDWFALLNRGVDVKAVGSSDSHTVGDPVGQGRTYVRSGTDEPGALDVDALCDAFVAGRTSIALGLFVEIDVAGAGPGDVVTPEGDALPVRVRVSAPSWIRPREVRLFVNGVPAAEHAIEAATGAAVDETWSAVIPRPAHDAWVVAVALGDGIEGPYWPTMKDYTCGATNPVRVDVDGDGRFSWPRETAEALLAGGLSSVGGVDDGVGAQLVDLAVERPELRATLRELVTPGAALERHALLLERRLRD